MDRPTCGTCPYWRRLAGLENELIHKKKLEDGDEIGECHRFPPLERTDARTDPDDSAIHARGLWAVTFGDFDFCGEHPDFPAYIASSPKNPLDPASGSA